MMKLPGVALITGAGGTGIGAAVARAFARAGCSRFAITDINTATLADTKEAILGINPSAEVHMKAGDIADDQFVGSFTDSAVGIFKRIDYGVNCAGVLGESLRSHETPTAAFDRITRINYKGTWLSSRAQLGQMLQQDPLPEHPRQRGAVVNIASQLGIVARPTAGQCRGLTFMELWLTIPAPYCASKAAIINMTRSDAIDYSKDDIRVNCVCPGVIETPMTTGTEEVTERLKPAVQIAPMGRMGLPDEVADAVLFLCSGRASFIQGHALVVDGGYTIN